MYIKEKIKKLFLTEEDEINIINILILSILVIFIIFGLYLYEFALLGLSNKQEYWGAFGDFLGGILNPIFAFSSFIALLYTIKQQSKELSLSRQELSETKKATEESAKALKEQSDSIKLQNFENTFFNMLDLHNKIVENIEIDSDNLKIGSDNLEIDSNKKVFKAREAIKEIYNYINISSRKVIFKNFDYYNYSENKYIEFTSLYDNIHDKYQGYLGHYFRNIYQILKFVSKSDEAIDKKKYSNLFRAQFSTEELQLLFYHCAGTIGSKKFKNYIEEFEFFEHLVLVEKTIGFEFIFIQSIYKLNAFGDNKEKVSIFIKNRKK